MKRNLQLDFLRFWGIILVMIHHVTFFNTSLVGGFFQIVQRGGWIGVDLFFVLSGYLVSGLIIKEYKVYNSFNAKTFLIRRGFKIYPAFYLFLFYQFFFNLFLTKHPQSVSGLFHEAIFVGNYFSSNNAHIWSICVEEHFYILLSLFFLFLIKYKKVNLNAVCYTYVILLLIGIAFRLNNYLSYSDFDFKRDYARSHFRFDGLFFGVLLSYITHYRADILDKLLNNPFKKLLLIFCALFLISNFVFDRETHRLESVINLAINPICFGYIMINLINFNNASFLKIISPF